jgi:hypothetical protein
VNGATISRFAKRRGGGQFLTGGSLGTILRDERFQVSQRSNLSPTVRARGCKGALRKCPVAYQFRGSAI